MTCEAGWTVSYSAKRWHIFSCALVWLLATNPKILVGEGSLSEEGAPGRHHAGRGNSAHSAPPFPFPSQVAQHLTTMGALWEGVGDPDWEIPAFKICVFLIL